jgi:hypothetical protein
MNIKSGTYTSYMFETPDETSEFTLVYHVFIFFIKINTTEQHELIRKFNKEKANVELRKLDRLPIKRIYDENDFMSFDTLEAFNKKKRWDLIVTHVINNPDFYTALNSLNKKTFNVRKS